MSAFALVVALGGCTEKPMLVTSAPQAVEIAKTHLKSQGYALAPRYEATGDGVVWIVVPQPPPEGPASYAVVVDPHTGKAEIGAFQSATIDEEL